MIGFVGQNSTFASIQAFPAVLTIPYASTAGNTLAVFTAAVNNSSRGVVNSVIDSNGASWTRIATSGAGNPRLELWGIVNSPAVASVIVSFFGNVGSSTPYSAGIAEYSGVSAIINGISVGNTGTSSPISITQTLTSGNNWIVAGDAVAVSGGSTITIGPNGNQRFSINAGAGASFGAGFGDNTSTSTSLVEIDFNFTGAASVSFGLSAELQSSLPATTGNIISTTRTASPAAASSTATPYDSGSITTWSLPGKTAQKLVDGSQSYSTQKGQLFTDFTQKNILATSTTTLSTQEGNPKQNS